MYFFLDFVWLLVGDYTEDPNFDLNDYLKFRETCPDPEYEEQ